MALAFKRIKVYLKLVVTFAVATLVLLVVVKNWEHKADVWFFALYRDVNVVKLILVTAVSSILGWWGVRKVAGVVREYREVRRCEQAETKLDEQRRLARELAEREKRIDDKVRRSLTEET